MISDISAHTARGCYIFNMMGQIWPEDQERDSCLKFIETQMSLMDPLQSVLAQWRPGNHSGVFKEIPFTSESSDTTSRKQTYPGRWVRKQANTS